MKVCIAKSIKNIVLISLAICSISGAKVFAADNVLQAVQIDGVNDTYNIVLRSDDTAEVKKTIQAPNKMILSLKGIRASKSINTIYNNTANVDSVVVEPTGEDSVKVLIQADNVEKADVKFDTLKTPLGVLGTKTAPQQGNEVVLNKPMQSYKPVYNENGDEESAKLSLGGVIGHTNALRVKKALKDERISWFVTFGLFAIFVLSGVKLVKGKDNEIKVGLSQGLNQGLSQNMKEREMDLLRSTGLSQLQESFTKPSLSPHPIQNPVSNGYGLRAYQNSSRSPYVSSEIQRPRTAAAPSARPTYGNLGQQPASRPISQPIQQRTAQMAQPAQTVQNTMQNTIKRQTIAGNATRPKTTNIDSMKFLESMTKIYEKNGRTDLAQGLRTSMKKAKSGIA